MMAKALACLVAGVAVLASSSVAQAGTRVTAHRVMGHKVQIVKWRPATGVRALVGFSPHHQTVPGWPGTDGNGFWRSNVVRFRDGSVELVGRMEGTIHSIEASARAYDDAGFAVAAARALTHAAVWAEHLVEVKVRRLAAVR